MNISDIGIDEKVKLDLTNPIFAFYINVNGLSRQRADEEIKRIQEDFNFYENCTIWILPINDDTGNTRIECIYDGSAKNHKVDNSQLIDYISDKAKILTESESFEEYKSGMRDWKINEVIK